MIVPVERKKRDYGTYYQANREKILANAKARYIADPEKYRKKALDWINRNRTRVRKLSLEAWLLREYNLTVEQYNALYLSQNGRCAICLKEPKKERLAVDHCHVTNRVRGLLCRKCNSGIGLMEDSVDFVSRALLYLEKGAKDGQATRKR